MTFKCCAFFVILQLIGVACQMLKPFYHVAVVFQLLVQDQLSARQFRHLIVDVIIHVICDRQKT